MDSASTQNMDSHMAAPVFSSAAPGFSLAEHNHPSDGVFSASGATISAPLLPFLPLVMNHSPLTFILQLQPSKTPRLLPSPTSTLLQWFLPQISQQQQNSLQGRHFSIHPLLWWCSILFTCVC
jgi:hypothetical protein